MTAREATDLLARLGTGELSRRRFLGVAAGSLVVAIMFDPRRAAAAEDGRQPIALAGESVVAGWVAISADGLVTVLYGGAEMGQGTSTAHAQIVAEELGARWEDVRLGSAPWENCFLTAGSGGVRNRIESMRTAGARARELLFDAAAAAWGLGSTAGFVAAESQVTFDGRSLPFAELAPAASLLAWDAARTAPLLKPGTLIGQSRPRLDIPAKTDGSATFGIDVRVPGMVYASVQNSPVLGGRLKATPARPAGALAVVNLDTAVAVVHTNTWSAIQAARSLKASWLNPADSAANTSSTILSTARTLMAGSTGVAVAEGDPAATATALGTPTVDQTYQLPYLAHMAFEVLSATAVPTYAADGTTLTALEVWAPHQGPRTAQAAVAALVPGGIPVTVRQTLLGGGFGRKIETDFVLQAVRTALAVRRPVKLTWSREEDVTHDHYRPFALARVRAKLDDTKSISAWSARIVAPSIAHQRNPNRTGTDTTAVEGATSDRGIPYVGASSTRLVEFVRHPATIPVGYWRSVGYSHNVFAVESAMDELARAAGEDEYLFRRRHLEAQAASGATATIRDLAGRAIAVLDRAAELGDWTSPVPAGRARGISLAYCYGSLAGEVVELSATASAIRVHRVAVVLGCGTAVNPDAVKAQLEGGVSYALSAALWGQVTFRGGKADQTNFRTYRMLRIGEMPLVRTDLVLDPAHPIGGAGELAVPGIAPAVASAHAKLRGTRVRTLPFFPGATMAGG